MNKVIATELVILAVLLIIAFCLIAVLTGDGAQPAMSAEPEILPSQTEETIPVEETEPEPTWMTFPQDRQITAKQYFVYDAIADEFVTISGEKNDPIYPASVTKLFTCFVALQYLPSDLVITVGDELDMVVAGSSVAGLRKGDKLTVSQLVEAMLLPSGNDAAYVLAVNTAKAIMDLSGQAVVGAFNTQDYIDLFMAEMNQQADQLGMTGTHFANPDGIHRANHYMSFQDLALLGKLSASDETILKNAIISQDTVTFVQRGAAVGELDEEELGDTVQWKNTNAIINPESEYYCPYATGLKTGQTPSAGSCLLSSFAYEGRQYIIGVFGCPDVDARFADTLQLFNQTIGI